MKKGGACNVKRYFCNACAVTSDECAAVNDVPCAQWCQPCGQQICYHHDMCCDATIEQSRHDLEEIIASHNHLSVFETTDATVTTLPGSKIHYKLEQADATDDRGHIQYQPVTTTEKIKFSQLLDMELKLCNMPVNGGISTCHDALASMIQVEV